MIICECVYVCILEQLKVKKEVGTNFFTDLNSLKITSVILVI